MAKRKSRYGALWTAVGSRWIYRRPVLEAGKFRCRKRGIPGGPEEGKTERITLKATNLTDAKDEVLREADKERKEAAEAAGEPGAVEARDVAVAAALDEWFTFIEKTQGFRGATIDDYRRQVGQYKEALGPERMVSEIEYRDIEKLMKERWGDREPRTKVGHLDKLGAFFTWAMRQGFTRRNPAVEFPRPKAWQKARKRATRETGQGLTLPEMRRLLDATRAPFMVDYRPDLREDGEEVPPEKLYERKPPEHLFTFVFVSLRTALRVSNLTGTKHKPPLAWRNVDENGILSLPGDVMKGGEPLRVPLHREAVEFLKQLRAERTEGGRIPPADAPIVGPIRELKKSFATALVRAKLADPVTHAFLGELRAEKPRRFRLHDLRHAALSLMGANVPSYVAEILAGHAASTQNAQYARHITIEDLRSWLEKLPPLLGTAEKKVGKKIQA